MSYYQLKRGRPQNSFYGKMEEAGSEKHGRTRNEPARINWKIGVKYFNIFSCWIIPAGPVKVCRRFDKWNNICVYLLDGENAGVN